MFATTSFVDAQAPPQLRHGVLNLTETIGQSIANPVQLNIRRLPVGGVMSAMAFAVFSFVGFESSATLAEESADPQRNVPLAVMGSVALAGIFFTLVTYSMVMGSHDNAAGHCRLLLTRTFSSVGHRT